MTLDHDRLDTMNDRANWLFGKVLLGKADLADIREFERSAHAFQHEATIDSQACDQWLDSHSAQDYLASSEE